MTKLQTYHLLAQAKHLNLTNFPIDFPSYPYQSVEENESVKILKSLEKARWNRLRAAKDLGIPYSTLNYKIKKLDIS